MSDWNLTNPKEIHPNVDSCTIVCDLGGVSRLLTLYHPGLARDETLTISVAGYLAEAPWLEAGLKSGNAEEPQLQFELKGSGSVDLVLKCLREPTDQEIVEARSSQFTIAIALQTRRSSGHSQNHRVAIHSPNLTTLDWQPPTIQLQQAEIIEISRVDRQERSEVDLFDLFVRQPTARLAYGGEDVEAYVAGVLRCLVNGEVVEIPAKLHSGDGATAPSQEGLSCPLRSGEETRLVGTGAINDIFQAVGDLNKVRMQFVWTCSFSDSTQPAVTDTYIFDLHLRQGEILQVKHQDALAVPTMSGTPKTHAERFPLEFSVPVLHGGIQFDVGDTIRFETITLDDSWFVVAHAHIQPEGAPVSLIEREDFNLAQDIRIDPEGGFIEVPLHNAVLDDSAEIDRYQLFLRFEAKRLKMLSGTAADFDDDIVDLTYGTIVVDIALRHRDPKYLICLDYGASAVASWFGRVERNLARQLIPLGSYAYSLVGAHQEYDPNKKRWQNVLIPSAVGLNPVRHMRSRKDPLSYGSLAMTGTSLQAAEQRMAAADRTYDVSIPVDRDFITEGEAPAYLGLQPVVITDLKRRLMNTEVEFRHRTKQSVVERTSNGLQATREISLASLMRDTFHELGSYVIANALFYAHDQFDATILTEYSDERFNRWLECSDSDVQVVVTHPSGIANDKKELYKSAAKSFMRGLAGTPNSRAVREPQLVPEALSAAYFGISRMSSPSDGSKIFACVDIGASTVDASLIEVQMQNDSIEGWKVLAHYGATIGGANLDEALLAVLISNLRQLFSAQDMVFEDVELDHRYLRDEALRNALLPRLLDAKRALSATLMREAGQNGTYRWSISDEGSTFSVSLDEIVRGVNPGQPLAPRETEIPGSNGMVKFRVRTSATYGHSISIEISPDMLDANNPITNPTRSDPKTVSRTLGYAVPAMLIREARRLGVRDPQWVVTGRASLWPSIFSGIARTAQLLGQDSDAVPMRPFTPDDMKNATVYGAARLATSGLEITDGSDHAYALVLHDDGRGVVSDIQYLDTRSRSEGKTSVRFLPNRWLSRVLPGLNDPGSDENITRDEIIRLFHTFGQMVVVDQCQVKPGGVAGGIDQLVEISWERKNTDLEFTVGDVVVRQPRSRLAGT